MVRTKHQQRNHQERHKLNRAYHHDPAETHRTLFQSVREFLNTAGEKMRGTRTFRRKV